MHDDVAAHADAEQGVLDVQVVVVAARRAEPVEAVEVEAGDGGPGVSEVGEPEAHEHPVEGAVGPADLVGRQTSE